MNIYDEEQKLAKDMKTLFNLNITEEQACLILDYLEGSDYALGIENSKLYWIDIGEENKEIHPISLGFAIDSILDWQDDFSRDVSGVCMDDFTVEDMANDENYNNWCDIFWGTWSEREETRKQLLKLKLEESELLKVKDQITR